MSELDLINVENLNNIFDRVLCKSCINLYNKSVTNFYNTKDFVYKLFRIILSPQCLYENMISSFTHNNSRRVTCHMGS